MTTSIFVTLPVNDLKTSMRFYEALGYQHNPKFTDETAASIVISMGPDQSPIKNTGKETVRSLGGLWTIGEGEGEMPGGGIFQSIMTLGYDPQLKQFVGTFIAGVMTHLWPYSGTLDADEKVLTLDSEGPSFAGDGTMAKYQDIIEFLSDDHRTLSSRYLDPDGKWIPFMKAHYQRIK